MRTKNELYQQALRTVAMRRQTARALAQDAQAEAVQGHIGPHAEAGVDPLTLRVCAGEKPAVQQLSHPSKGGANEE